MKVVLINHSDTRGGASVVTRRLMHALRDIGVDARMLVTHKGSDDPYVVSAGPAWRVKASFMAEELAIAVGNGFDRDTLFKFSLGTYGLPLDRHPLVRSADAVILNWVNQGMLSFDTIERMAQDGKNLIWTMHDMWNLTGACHHAGECAAYLRQCGNCPMLTRVHSPHDMTNRTWWHKERLYTTARIQFVAVSQWLADRAARSSLLRHQRVRVIPNAFPVEEFAQPVQYTREDMGLPPDIPVIAMGAARLDDPVKDLPKAIEALNILADNGTAAHAVFFGALRQPGILDGLRLPYTWLGTISDPARLRAVYAHSTAVLSSSVYETLPGTLIEGQASGALPVSFGHGGQADIIDHLVNGYIARGRDAADLAAGLQWAIDPTTPRTHLRATVAHRFGAEAVVHRYLDLLK